MRIFAVAMLATSACAVDPTPSTDPGGKGDVWGTDDRMERYELSAGPIRDVAKSSLATLPGLRANPDGTYSPWGPSPSLQVDQHLCDGERFANQPVLADCSATLIAPDVALTAGHCFDTPDCSEIVLVLDFAYDAAGGDPMHVASTIPAANVFRCAEMLAWKFDADDQNNGNDYALLRLDRASDRTPAKVDWNGPQAADAPIYAIGYPAGIPLKVSPGKVLEPMATSQFFTHDADVFGGNSGGGVFGRDGALVGVHSASSGKRYIPGPSGQCNVAAECGVNTTCPAKPVAYNVRALAADLTPELRARIGAP